ncbi:pancreatic triacylglycerol lipase [Tetranychus urticae]|uniref:pancreatic triacylglycerol lipase n=2 Tax=Tetranychus urticae TaxID=32264 RepID=UPI00077BB871|nr:pancreatic triacylglycerol lipase [Tetranychus urticae]XP_015786688.1 pancreatic triacylglycerol lipase [Tetranychus urticae]XP_015786704.1 pancreatic triacylglycerol lipase [Tetranychus urticae]XP_025018403.1 pancreatic triacylglycerol lipase [Tetranychus urticae]XP_025018404.1 pancreatic triacylglycerol lipase [Tetranychus urticae]
MAFNLVLIVALSYCTIACVPLLINSSKIYHLVNSRLLPSSLTATPLTHHSFVELPSSLLSSSSSSTSSLSNSFTSLTNSLSSFFISKRYFNDLDAEENNPARDYAIWSAIASSLAKWNHMRVAKLRQRFKLKSINFSRSSSPSPSTSTTTTSPSSSRLVKHRVRRDEEMVCYRNIGCFRDEGPFDYLDTLPAAPEVINTTFTLYTRLNPIEGSLIDLTNTTSSLNDFKESGPVKIIIHGFGSTGRDPWVLQMTEALLYVDDVNVIVVDWGNGAALPNYVQAAANTQLVGKQIALLIKMLMYEKGLKSSDFHLIGFSLGAHIAGFTGTEVKNLSRITGLDPASPLFEGYTAKVRLDSEDAQFVDIIHSNGDSFLRGGLGSFEPMGHVDFYPNGGRNQVGCNSVFVGAINDIFYGRWQSLCHHRRAFRFFIDSVVATCKFHAFQCDNYAKFLRGECFDCGKDGTGCGNMGYFANQSPGRGKMYLVTRDSEPFCANQYKIQIDSSSGQSSTWGKLEVIFLTKDRNETFQLTSESDEIKDESLIQGLVVAHPLVRNITSAIVKYTKYRGWIYSGKDFWGIDKIVLTNSDGEMISYCGYNTILEDSIPLQLELVKGNCTVEITADASYNNRLARLVWQVVSGPSKGRPPKLLWRLSLASEDI